MNSLKDPNNMNIGFPNPSKPEERVYAILVRNTLASCGIIVDENGNKVMWHTLQENEGLCLGNSVPVLQQPYAFAKMSSNLNNLLTARQLQNS